MRSSSSLRLQVIALVLVLVGCSSKRHAATGMGVGAGIALAGIAIYASGPVDTDESRGGSLGVGMFAVGSGVFAISFLALLARLGLDVDSEKPRAAPVEPSGRKCRPIEPNSEVWTCGEGWRCTDDLRGCEPVNGLPTLRQRDE